MNHRFLEIASPDSGLVGDQDRLHPALVDSADCRARIRIGLVQAGIIHVPDFFGYRSIAVHEDGFVHKSSFAPSSPPKLGGVDAHQKNIAKPPSLARPGWFPALRNHPVCAASERNLLFNGAATPPNLGGEPGPAAPSQRDRHPLPPPASCSDDRS